MVNNTPIWKSWGKALEEGFNYVNRRATGEIQSLKTSWNNFNSIGLNGIEWNAIITLSSRPGVGKTLIAVTLTRDLLELNQDQDFLILHFNFEMLARNLAVRELSAKNNLDIRYIQSAQDNNTPKISRTDLLTLREYTIANQHRKEFIVDEPLNVKDLAETIINFYNTYKKPMVITLDHTLLIPRHPGEKNSQETLQNLSTTLTYLKNHFPVTFIILSQLNRDIENSERQIPGKLSNYPTSQDIYGSDFLQQCSDVVLAYNLPSKYSLKYYGPKRYVLEPTDQNLLACHVLKNRFGSLGIKWFRANYSTMSIVESYPPRTA